MTTDKDVSASENESEPTTPNKDVSTSENESETTAKEPRSVSELLELKTFQGMTDEEIQSIIDWRVENAINSEEMKTKQAAIITSMNTTAEAYAKAATESNDILKALLTNGITLTTIDSNGNTEKEVING